MKKIRLCFYYVSVLLLAAAFAGCNTSESAAEGEDRASSFTLMTWNVNNLFDGNDDGYEYAEFLQSAGWSAEKYRGRLNTMSAAIGRIDPRPDIIIMQEIESRSVLEDVALSLNGGYSWSHFANNHGAAVGLGIISRLPFLETKSHSITIGGDTTPRPVLETRIQTEEGAFVIFACHWKSKLGGDRATESVRRASARVVLRRIRELWESEPALGIIVAGDLNENHDEFYRQGAGYISALLPDDSYCAQMTGGRQMDFIVIKGNMPPEPVHFPDETIVLFSPWLHELENGSYFYRRSWETIDHFLISSRFFDDDGWKYERAFVADFEPFINRSGTPFSYNARTGSGLSDHLPLLITLRMAAVE